MCMPSVWGLLLPSPTAEIRKRRKSGARNAAEVVRRGSLRAGMTVARLACEMDPFDGLACSWAPARSHIVESGADGKACKCPRIWSLLRGHTLRWQSPADSNERGRWTGRPRQTFAKTPQAGRDEMEWVVAAHRECVVTVINALLGGAESAFHIAPVDME